MKVLYVIAARGGSKGVPKKNIRVLGGLPLIAYKIISAKKSKVEKRIIVSTDDDEIATTAKQYGAEVPFIRPKELATDSASSISVVEHAIKWTYADDDISYDYICLLEPSSPFATYEDIDNALSVISESHADTVLGMKAVEVCRELIFELDENGGLSYFNQSIKKMDSMRRQDQKPQFTMNGCMYIARMEYFLANKSFHSDNSKPYIMPWERSIEIDTEQDLRYAEYLVDNHMIDMKYWN